MVWHFSIPPGYPGRYGKMPNHSKIAPGGLGLSLGGFFPQILALQQCSVLMNSKF